MKYVIATNNAHKLIELAHILEDLGVEAISLKAAGVTDMPEETGQTFEENALIKARAACLKTGLAAIADDSGLVVDALHGQPGVYSARYGAPEAATDRDRTALLLKNMAGMGDRTARFACACACVFPGGDVVTAYGCCEGVILDAPRGGGGFGYDPVFYVPQLGMTFSQMPEAEKNRISHRGKALRALKIKIAAHLEGQDA